MKKVSNDENAIGTHLNFSTSTILETSTTKTRDVADSDASEVGKFEPEQPDDTSEYVTGVKLVVIVASVVMACFLMLVDTMVVSTAIPKITDQFNSLADVGWYASAYQFGSAAPQPLTGKIYTHFNTKWSFLVFFGIFEVGSVLCGAAASSVMLIVGRAIAGLGAAGIINGALVIVSSCAPLEKRPGLIGLVIGFNQLGLVAGPLIGGVFTTYSTWRWCFYINLPLGAITIIAVVILHIPEPSPKAKAITLVSKLHHHLDLLGFVLFAPAVLQLLLALQYGDVFGWSSSEVIGLFCGSAATFIVWFFWNRHKGDDALLPYSMIRQRIVWTAGLYQACLMSAFYGAIFFLPIYFQAIKNANAMLSAVYLLPTILPQLVMAASSGPILMRIGYVIPLALFSTVFLAIASGLYSMLGPHTSTGNWVGFQIMAGIGMGAGPQVVRHTTNSLYITLFADLNPLKKAIIAIQAAVAGEDLSSAMAFIVFAQSLGTAIFLALCNLIFDSSLKTELPQHAPHANATAIIDVGATGFRAIVESQDLPGVLVAYSNSVDRVFYLIAAIAAMCGVVLWGMGWKDLRKKDEIANGNVETSSSLQ